MNKQQAKERIAKLRQEINHHNYLYHVLDKPTIPDGLFDSLKNELEELERQWPDLITPDSPTQRVSGQPLDKFKKVRHSSTMLSMFDAFGEQELEEWEGRIQKVVPGAKLDYFCELKIDGLAVALIYDRGVFVQGATRGNGEIGEDITQNLRTIKAIPLKLGITKAYQKLPAGMKKKVEQGKAEVKGEVFMNKKDFEKLNQEQKKKDLTTYANPRNVAAGSVRQLDPKITASRQLDFFAYSMVTDLGQKNHAQEHEIMGQLGFKINHYNRACPDLAAVKKFHQEMGKKRNKLPYLIDGVLVVVNNRQLHARLGRVGKAFRYMIAYKYSGEQATTVVEDIQVQIGRTGALTPVAHLRPVLVAGSTVSRATLHNEDEIKRLGIKIGDTAVIQKAGDVIPDVIKVLPRLRTGREKSFHMPSECPVCGSQVVRRSGEAAHYCTNKHCFAQNKERIYHFVSKKAFDIEGLGPKIIDQLINEGLIKDAADIFTLTKGDLEPLERFAEKAADNLTQAIEQSKTVDLSRFIIALGIRHVGEETALDLAKYFGGLEKIKKASQEELNNMYDIGEVVAQSIADYFQDKKNLAFIKRLQDLGIKIIRPKKEATKLQGKRFVLTGSLETMSREEAKTKIREAGGDIVSSVSKNTDYVVAGADPGSKIKKAKELDVRVISEDEFMKIIKD